VRGRRKENFLAAAPETSTILDASPEMFQIDKNDAVGRYQDHVDLAILPSPARLAHHEVGEALPGPGKRSAQFL
jgi:hypothetical protein